MNNIDLNWKDQFEARNLSKETLIKVFPQYENHPYWEVTLPPLIN